MTTPPDSTPPDSTPPDSTPPLEVPLLQLRDGLPTVVDDAAGLAVTIDSFRAGTGPFAIDAERASGYRYSQRAYLLQLRREGAGTALIDPIGFGDVPNQSLVKLSDTMSDVEWVIHAASQDLPCLAALGMRPHRLFDTELAGRLLNYPRVGLAVLVEELLGYRMRKEHSAVDWSRRPLPEPWLRYAALDVEMLIELRDVLARELGAAGKAQWAAQEFAAWAAMGAASPRLEPWRRVSGIHRVRGRRGLALVRAMWQLRDDLARVRDITTNRILSDATIIEAAQTAPTSRTALGRIAGFATRGGQRYLREFATVIADAQVLADGDLPTLSAQQDGPPPPRTWPDKFPAAAARLASCREALRSLAEQYELPQENLLAPDAVRRLAWAPPIPATPELVRLRLEASAARPWQVTLTAEALAESLAVTDT
ncbi:MAG: HRDC domain-containing protein [Propionibacteriales bacterium]|nr:HRDC domain-containing protein [Propionibacteriales bacterium]